MSAALQRLTRLLIHVAACLVPADSRDEWRREWLAELDAARRAPRSVVRFAIGAPRHAIWMRVQPWRPAALAADLRVAIRTLRRRPGLTAAATTALALGMGASIAIFTVVDAVLLRPLPYPEPHRLVEVWTTFPGWRAHPVLGSQWDRMPLSWPEYEDLREDAAMLEAIALYVPRVAVVTGDGAAREIAGAGITASFLPLLGARVELGRGFLPSDESAGEPVVILSHEYWMRALGGRSDVLTQTLELDGQSRRVVGVLARGFDFQAEDFFEPVSPSPATRADRDAHGFRGLGRLAGDVTVEQARDEAAAIVGGDRPDAHGARLRTIADARLGPVRQPLSLLLAAAALLWLVSCANVAGLLAGDTASRRQEIVIRASLGAGRARLLRQFLVESLALGAAGTGAGLLVASVALPALLAMAPSSMPRINEVQFDGRIVAFAIVSGLLASALAVTGSVAMLTRGAGRAAGARVVAGSRLQAVIAAGEVALVVVLLVAAGLLARSFDALSSVETGFKPDGLLTLRVSSPAGAGADAAGRFQRAAIDRLSALPGVEAVATTSSLAFSGASSSSSVGLSDLPPGAGKPEAQRRLVSHGYFETMGMPIVAGRGFTTDDRAGGAPVAVVSESFAARYLAGQPLGRRIAWDPDDVDVWFEVIGVAGDVRHQGLAVDVQPTFYLSTAQVPARSVRFVVRTSGDAAALVPGVVGSLHEIDPAVVAADIATMDQLIGDSIAQERFRALLLVVFAATAFGLCAIGLYAVMARAVRERRRELAVRIAVGAKPIDVAGLVVRRGLVVVGLGAAAGGVAAIAAAAWLRAMLFGITASDPVVLGGVLAVVVLLAAVAIAVPARRAVRIDPVESLRA